MKKKRRGGVNEKYVEGVVARNNTRKCMKIVVEERKAEQGKARQQQQKMKSLCDDKKRNLNLIPFVMFT